MSLRFGSDEDPKTSGFNMVGAYVLLAVTGEIFVLSHKRSNNFDPHRKEEKGEDRRISDPNKISGPGGWVEKDDTDTDTLNKELKEEALGIENHSNFNFEWIIFRPGFIYICEKKIHYGHFWTTFDIKKYQIGPDDYNSWEVNLTDNWWYDLNKLDIKAYPVGGGHALVSVSDITNFNTSNPEKCKETFSDGFIKSVILLNEQREDIYPKLIQWSPGALIKFGSSRTQSSEIKYLRKLI